MTPGLIKMWFSFGAMGAMGISAALIHVTRTKIKSRLLSIPITLVAYVLLVASFLIMIYLVFNGPERGA